MTAVAGLYEARAKEQYVVFTLRSTRFAVPILQVLRIIRQLPMTQVPRAPDFLEGVINDQGQVVPVVDLRKRLGLHEPGPPAAPSTSEDGGRILILELPPTSAAGEQRVGLLVDAVIGIVRIADSDIQPPPPMVAQVNGVYLTGVAQQDEALVMVLNPERVLTVDEVAQVSRWYGRGDV